jgi:hypothetical protein
MRLPSVNKRSIYGNCAILAPDGQMLCRCDSKKANWYLKRGLAFLEKESPLTIRLKFEPKGRGCADDPYYLAEKPNRCVVCGREDRLTKHHAVPYFFRKMFPPIFKKHSSHDVVPVCTDCHTAYEPKSQELRKQIAKEMGFEPTPAYRNPRSEYSKLAWALHTHGKNMPEARKNEILQKIAKDIGHVPTMQEIDDIYKNSIRRKKHSQPEVINWMKEVEKAVSKMTDEELHAFCRRWRRHFIDTMAPKFMLSHWDVNHMRKEWTDPEARRIWERNNG